MEVHAKHQHQLQTMHVDDNPQKETTMKKASKTKKTTKVEDAAPQSETTAAAAGTATAQAPEPAPAATPHPLDSKIESQQRVVNSHKEAIAKGDLKGDALKKREAALSAATKNLETLIAEKAGTGITPPASSANGKGTTAAAPAQVPEAKPLVFSDLKEGGLYLSVYGKETASIGVGCVPGKFPFFVTMLNKRDFIASVVFRYPIRQVAGRTTNKPDEPAMFTFNAETKAWTHFADRTANIPVTIFALEGEARATFEAKMKEKDEYNAKLKAEADQKAAAAAKEKQVEPAPQAAPATTTTAPAASGAKGSKKKAAASKAA